MRLTPILTAAVLGLSPVVAVGQPAHSACQVPPAIAHRGDVRLYTENTLPANAYALRQGARYFENDLRWTRTGSAMAMHDATVDRTTNGSGLIARKTTKQVRALRTREGYRVPYLSQILGQARRSGATAVLHVKPLMTAAQLSMLIRRVRDYGMLDRVIINSMPENLVRVERLAPRVKTGRHDFSGDWARNAVGPWDYYIPTYESTTSERIAWAHSRDIDIIATAPVETVKPETWEQLSAWGSDLVMTDEAKGYTAWERQACAATA